jgi:serine protease Do
MKRSLTLCITLLLAGSSVALAGTAATNDYDQDSTERPRRIRTQNSGFLGVNLSEITRDSANRLKLRDERGALITSVISDTSAAKAGLQKDDVIVKWNGESIESSAELSRHIRETPAGRPVRLGVIRNGSETEFNVTLGDRADYQGRARVDRDGERGIYRARPARARAERERPERARPERAARVRMTQGYRMGVSLQGMSPQLAEYFGLGNRKGALVGYVNPDSSAAKAGIKAGDVILSVAGQAVEHPFSIHQILMGKPEGPVEVKVMRDKQERTFTVQLEAEKVSSWVYSTDDLAPVIVSVPDVIVPQVVTPRVVAPRVVVPSIAPLSSFKYRYVSPVIAPMAVQKITIPKITIPKLHIPRINIPPIKIMMPLRMFMNPV